MECQSSLYDPTSLVIADASVVINLNATGFAASILEALPNRFAVVREVVLELENGQRHGRNDADALNTLVATGHVDLVWLESSGTAHFTSLISGSATQTLDDGEAATIAYALEHGAIALIDERKANRICAERYGSLTTGCTIDLLAHTGVVAALGRVKLADGVFNALYRGRMRVPTQHVNWVVNLIGPERTAQCVSLPRSVRQSGSSYPPDLPIITS